MNNRPQPIIVESVLPAHAPHRHLTPQLIALALASSFGFCQAQAACTTDAPSDGATVICTGADTVGVNGVTAANVTVVIQSGASIQATGSMNGAVQLDAHGSVTNYGLLTANGNAAHGMTTGVTTTGSNALGGSTLINAGSIIVNGSLSIGMNPNGGQVTLLNSGSITANGPSDSGIFLTNMDNTAVSSLTNTGTILVNAVGAGQFGIYSSGNTNVMNSGRVVTLNDNTVGLAAGLVGVAPTIVNDAAGLVQTSGNSASALQLYVVGAPPVAGVGPLNQTADNRGSLMTLGNNSAGADIELAGHVSFTLSNTGTIATSGTNAAGVSVHTDGSLTNTATVSNSGQITTTGAQSSALVLEAAAGDGALSIVNSGSIAASGASALAIDATSAPVRLNVTNLASGIISSTDGNAIASAGTAVLINQGAIHGNVALSAGINAVTLFTGSSIAGALDIGSNAASGLTLEGAGSASYAQAVTGNTTFAGELTKAGSGHWTIDNALTAHATQLLGGALTVGNGATSGSLSGPVTIANGAALVFDRSDAVVFGGTVNGNGTLTQAGSGSTILASGGTLLSTAAGASAVTVAQGSLSLSGFTLNTLGAGADAIHLVGSVGSPAESLSVNSSHFSSALGAAIGTDSSVGAIAVNASTVTAAAGQSLLDLRHGSQVATVFDDSRLTGNITTDATSTGGVTLQNQTVLSGAIASVALAISGNSTWNLTNNSTVAGLDVGSGATLRFASTAGYKSLVDTQALTGTGGQFAMNTNLSLLQGDHITILGTSAGAHQVQFNNVGGAPNAPFQALEVIATTDGAAQFRSPVVNAGIYAYNLVKGTGAANAPIVTNWYLLNQLNPNQAMATGSGGGNNAGTPQLSPTGAAVIDTAAASSLTWFTQLDSLEKRMGDLQDATSATQSDVWGRINGAHWSATSVNGSSVSDHSHGVDFGIDHTLVDSRAATVIAGGFVGAARSDRAFASGSAAVTTGYAGAYATVLMPDGWYADVVAKAQRLHNSFDTNDGAGQLGNGRYGQWSTGASVEVGQKIGLDGAWYVMPQAQFAITHLTDARYITSNGVPIAVSDADVLQSRLGVRVGERLRTADSLADPYVKLNVINQSTSGGNVMAGGARFKAQLDGTRVDAGAGLSYTKTAHTELHIDVERSISNSALKQDWALNVGLRYSF